MADRLLEREDAELARVMSEVARERSPTTWMRTAANQNAVAASRMRRVLHDRPDVLFVANLVQRRRHQAIIGCQTTEEIHRALAPLGRELGNRVADGPALRRIADATNDDPRPVDRYAMEAISAGLLELDTQLLAQAGVA